MKRLLERIKLWWNGTPVQVRPERVYSIAGWVRGADGDYWKGVSRIIRRGRAWVRIETIGGVEETYPTLHAAIKQEMPEPKADPATLFPQIERDLEQ